MGQAATTLHGTENLRRKTHMLALFTSPLHFAFCAGFTDDTPVSYVGELSHRKMSEEKYQSDGYAKVENRFFVL